MENFYEFLKKVDLIKFGIAFTIMICLNGIVWALVTREIPAGNREIVIHTLGIIEGVIVSIAAFYWGSSSGSKEKTEAMAKRMGGYQPTGTVDTGSPPTQKETPG